MLKVFSYLRKRDWLLVLFSMVFIVVQVAFDLSLPDYMAQITTLVQTEGSQMSDILIEGAKMLTCALGSLVATIFTGFFIARISATLAWTLRRQIFYKTMSFSLEEMKSFSTASLITRSTNDITQVQLFIVMGLQAMIKSPITAIWAITKISNKAWQWTAVTAGAVVFLLIMLAVLITLAMPKFKRIQVLTDDLNRVTREQLTGIRVVRAYNAEDFQDAKFESANRNLTRNNLFANNVMAFMSPGMMLIMSGLTLSIYWVGTYLIDAAGMVDKLGVFSDMVVFSSYAMQVVMAFMMLTVSFIMFPRASVAAHRINEVLGTQPKITDGQVGDTAGNLTNAQASDEIVDAADAQVADTAISSVSSTASSGHGEIEFRHVDFQYPDAKAPVLHDLTFTARSGETVAIIGATGSGKSSILNLIPRFYDATAGEILVDGLNVKDYKLAALRNKIGYVPQKATLFKGSVESNVAFGDNGKEALSEEWIRKALDIAQATEFVEQMEGGLQAEIAQLGTNVSGGQKQRLSIARAVCRRPEIYLFDDSFSALDFKTDKLVRAALKEQTAGTTTLVVAQRVGTVLEADKIIVLDEGRIVGQGTHAELLETCAIYREIAESQLTEEEIERARR